MNNKWYPNIIDIIDNSIVVFDTSALLNVYRYSLVSSKRIFNYIKKYEDKIWIPSQVKKEFYKNKEKVRSINLYKNLDNKLIRHVETKRDELLVQLSEYEKKRFSKFSELKNQLEAKFLDMSTIIKAYKKEIAEETGVYKDFIEEVDSFLDSLLKSDKVSKEMNMVELLEVLKEGELRYRYNLPPGYEDAKNKEGIDKFGDLIMWKEILKKTSEINKKHIIFVTSDTKPDWFRKNNHNQVLNPREELISEFDHYYAEKELIIIPFENFIEELSDLSNQSDRDLLLELRMNNLVKRLSQESFKKIIEEKLVSIDINNLRKKVMQSSNGTERHFIQNLIEVSSPSIESVTINTNGIKVEKNEVIYYINIIAECDFSTVSYSSDIVSYGSIQNEITLNIELKRKLEDSETSFITAFKENPFMIAVVTHFINDKEHYIWGSDHDLEEEFDENDDNETEIYTTCPSCGRGISQLNDAGNGFCIYCPQ